MNNRTIEKLISINLIFALNLKNMFLAMTFEVLKYLLPTVVLYFIVRLIVSAYLENEEKKRALSIPRTVNQSTLALRLQAYERLILLLERITPSQVINRALQPGMTVYNFQKMLVLNIREEFEHNVAQQIYVSSEGWAMIKKAKEEITLLINTSAAELDGEAAAGDLAKTLLERWSRKDENPVQLAKDQLNSEVKELL